MTQVNKYCSTVDIHKDESMEMQAFGRNRIISWTDSFRYTIWDDAGQELFSGKLNEELPKNQLALTQINCIWFTPMENNTMLYLSLEEGDKASLKIWDLTKKTLINDCWATNLDVSRNKLSSFCWIHYNTEKKMVQLAFQEIEGNIKYTRVFKDQNGDNPNYVSMIEMENPNIFSENNNSLYLACNHINRNSLVITTLHTDGFNETTLMWKDSSKYTVQDFGFLEENFFYIIVVEGEHGKSKLFVDNRGHTVGCLMFNPSVFNLKAVKEIKEENMTWIQMEDSDPKKGTYPDIPDGFFMLNRDSRSVFATCSNGNFVGWNFVQEKTGGWGCRKETIQSESSELEAPNYCSSWDRELLFCYMCTPPVHNMATLLVNLHSGANKKLKYFWLLSHLVNLNQNPKWQPPNLFEMVDLIL